MIITIEQLRAWMAEQKALYASVRVGGKTLRLKAGVGGFVVEWGSVVEYAGGSEEKAVMAFNAVAGGGKNGSK